jgi:hypothetical protein
MAKLGQYDYPDYKIGRVLDVVEKLCRPPYKGEISRGGLAEMLALSDTGGGFAGLVASLKDYGLIEGRDKLKVTELGKRTVVGSGSEREQARASAFLNVPLFKELLEHIGPNVPDADSFSILLKEITREDPLKVNNQYRDVMGVYSEGIRLLDALKKPEMGGSIEAKSSPDFTVTTRDGTALFIEIKAGQYYQRLPYDAHGLDIAVRFLQGLKETVENKRKLEVASGSS